MNYQAILFDLDGTLLPMDFDVFSKGYLSLLARAVAPLGYEASTMLPAMWKGVGAMMKNDGSRPNVDAFWEVFSEQLGKDARRDTPYFDAFYDDEQGFHKAIAFTEPTPLAAKAVELARTKAGHVVLATNPLFPEVAVRSRLKWAGVSYDSFDLVTDYANSTTCKPNPAYFLEITGKLGVDPCKCLMIGNNVQEDIEAARAAGLDTFLLTDCLISKDGSLPDCPKGSFSDLIDFLDAL